MEVKRKFRTEKLKFPVDGYKYNVQVLTSIDGGKTTIIVESENSVKLEKNASNIFQNTGGNTNETIKTGKF